MNGPCASSSVVDLSHPPTATPQFTSSFEPRPCRANSKKLCREKANASAYNFRDLQTVSGRAVLALVTTPSNFCDGTLDLILAGMLPCRGDSSGSGVRRRTTSFQLAEFEKGRMEWQRMTGRAIVFAAKGEKGLARRSPRC